MKNIELVDDALSNTLWHLTPEDQAQLLQAQDLLEVSKERLAQREQAFQEQLAAEAEREMEYLHSNGLKAIADGQQAFLAAADRLGDRLGALLHDSLHAVFKSQDPSDLVAQVVAPIMKDLRSAGSVVLSVHPAQVKAVSDKLALMGAQFDQFEVEGDPELEPASGVLLTSSEVITVSIPILVEQLLSAIDTSSLQDTVQ